MYCTNCGHENSDENNYCTNCATPIKRMASTSFPASYAQERFIKKVLLPHAGGLPIASGLVCSLFDYTDRIEIIYGQMLFTLSKAKITDVSLKTDVEIQKQYTSSVGGAIGGAVLLGPLGAMIGGRTKKKVSSSVHIYLLFTYYKNGVLQHIGFDATRNRIKANKFVKDFQEAMKTSPRNTIMVDL